MVGVNTFEGGLSGRGKKFAIVAARFNEKVVDAMLEGALTTLIDAGVNEADIQVLRVPGCFELPLMARRVAEQAIVREQSLDAVIALGAVIRGGTPHFDFVSDGCTLGLMQVTLELDIPVAFGVLTCDTEAQALERSGFGMSGNKGEDAANTVLEMVNVLSALDT
ncbi:MAG: 6,7-dimethyl-8-ribityllumazine synthase [Pseudomonadales bacterium]|nr:6,7-dimethyl-8-ribityllumazine synthase [Pseudomonadales bacterium]